jgi:hypothetical protein
MDLKFEREPCTRCGGSGRHSWCEMHGDTCFKCGGCGKQLTKRAHVALLWLRELRTIPARDIKVGMRIRWSNLTLQVQEVAQDTKSSGSSLKDGVMVPTPPYLHIRGTKHGLSLFPDSKVQVIPGKEEALAQLTRAIAYQDSMTKQGKLRKGATAP